MFHFHLPAVDILNLIQQDARAIWPVATSTQHIVQVVVFQGLIDQLQRNKLLLIETQDAAETTLALANYQKVTLLLTYFDALIWATEPGYPLDV